MFAVGNIVEIDKEIYVHCWQHCCGGRGQSLKVSKKAKFKGWASQDFWNWFKLDFLGFILTPNYNFLDLLSQHVLRYRFQIFSSNRWLYYPKYHVSNYSFVFGDWFYGTFSANEAWDESFDFGVWYFLQFFTYQKFLSRYCSAFYCD